jgi:hypothetical protein
MNTGTQTTTFTLADIRKVVNNFGADYFMIGQSTGLRSRTQVMETVADLTLFADDGYLLEIVIILWDSQGNKVKARRYTVSRAAIGWKCDEPGDNNWPRMLDGRLQLIATLSDAWWQLSETEKESAKQRLGIQGGWSHTSTDTSFKGMNATQDRQFASSGFGMQRYTYA